MAALRIRFSKLGKIRFTSHRDVARIWERALRRAELPIAYSEGFSPRPKLSFGLALSTGYESYGEYLDVALPPGATSLQQAVTSCTWHIDVAADPPAVAAATGDALAVPELVVTRERKGQPVTDDVRPAILSAEVLAAAPGGTTIEAELATQPRGLRPAELLAAIDPAWRVERAARINQWTQVGGARRELIELPPAATPPRALEARAS